MPLINNKNLLKSFKKGIKSNKKHSFELNAKKRKASSNVIILFKVV